VEFHGQEDEVVYLRVVARQEEPEAEAALLGALPVEVEGHEDKA
jgi:hypothetical protein